MILAEKTLEVKPQSYVKLSIKVLSLRIIKHRRIKARCSVKAGHIALDNVLIIRSMAGCQEVAMPSNIVAILSPDLQKAIADTVLAAWHKGGVR